MMYVTYKMYNYDVYEAYEVYGIYVIYNVQDVYDVYDVYDVNDISLTCSCRSFCCCSSEGSCPVVLFAQEKEDTFVPGQSMSLIVPWQLEV